VAYILLALSTILMIIGIHRSGTIYGSMTDWISQQSVIPEYFRQKFYETGNLFPDFAMNLGGGQNIYNLSYYGFLSPIILISYLLPFVPMTAYISASAIAVVVVGACLCYRWLSSNGFSWKVAFVASICFAFAGPVIFQSHRQAMFMEYLPFLFVGLLGVDQYFKTHKTWLIALGAFLCIMTSYFFSIGALATLVLYGVFVSLGRAGDGNLKRIIRDIGPVVKGIFVAVLLSAVLWLPTLYVIIDERGVGEAIPLLTVLQPTLPFKALLFTSYSLGLTTISLIALIWSVFRGEKNERALGIILLSLLIFPIFLYILNGTLYLRAKALIPFLPLYILMIAAFLKRLENLVQLGKSRRSRNQRAIFIAILCLILCGSTLNCIRANTKEQWVKTADFEEYNSQAKIALMKQVLNRDKTFYRFNDLTFTHQNVNQTFGERYRQTSIYTSTFNKNYNDFYYSIMHNPISTRNKVMCVSSENVLFQDFMNVKYLIASGNVPSGYQKIGQRGAYTLYRNQTTMPLGFATDQILSEEEYGKIRFPDNMGTFFSNIVTGSGASSETATVTSSAKSLLRFHKTNLDLLHSAYESRYHVSVGKVGQVYNIHATFGATITMPVDFNLKNSILVLRFKVVRRYNPLGLDTSILVNGVENKLSSPLDPYPNKNNNFVYVLSSNKKTTKLNFSFSPGYYQIRNLEAYILPADAVKAAISQVDPLIVDAGQTRDNRIVGDIRATRDGIFATTIPYAKGFGITVDGKKQKYEMVNTAFVGFPIEKGRHHIIITYHAPGKIQGLLISAIGLVLFVFGWMRRKK